MDFYLASDSSPAIHSKTSAKVIKKNWDLQENRKVSCKSQIKLVIKQHIFKAFALTGRRGTTP